MCWDIIKNMFENLVIYVWQNPLDDNDCGAILIAVKDFDFVQSLRENIHDPGDPDAESFDELCKILHHYEISYYDMSSSMHYYLYTE